MATAAISSAAILEPSTLPQVSFTRADDLLNHAAQLRTNAEILKARAKETEDNAKQLEDSAAELQESAETLREHIQAKLDTTLERHGDVLKQFLLTPVNEEELKRLKISVEEGTSYVHQVADLGEQLLQFKSAKLESSHPTEGNSSRELSRAGNSAASSTRIPPPSRASPRAPSASIGGPSYWRYRINSLLGRRVADVDRPSPSSAVSNETRESSVEAHKEINASLGKDETRDDQDHGTSNIAEAPTIQSDIPAGAASSEVIQNAIVSGPDEDTTLATKIKNQTRLMKNLTEDNIVSSRDVHQSYVEEDFIPLNPPNASASRKMKRKRASSAISAPDAKRRKKVEEQRTTVFNEREALARYRKLFVNEKGPNQGKAGRAKKMLKREFKSEIERHNEMSAKERNQWIAYTMQQINVMVKREHEGSDDKAAMTRREHEGDDDDDDDDDSMVRRESECAANAEQAECCAAELSDESAMSRCGLESS